MIEVTIVILTLNEERNLRQSILSALTVAREILVVDSGSSDQTLDIASSLGCRVVHRSWTGFADQRNYALSLVRTEWALFVDADERLAPDLIAELACVEPPIGHDGYLVRRRNWFNGKELKHAGRYPDWQLRLLRTAEATFPRQLVHEHPQFRGKVGKLDAHLIHDSMADIDVMLLKHMEYARLEARTTGLSREYRFWGVASRNRQVRRQSFKHLIWLRFPARGAVRFIYLMGFKRGFLDGRNGYAYAKMLVAYEAMIDVFAQTRTRE